MTLAVFDADDLRPFRDRRRAVLVITLLSKIVPESLPVDIKQLTWSINVIECGHSRPRIPGHN